MFFFGETLFLLAVIHDHKIDNGKTRYLYLQSFMFIKKRTERNFICTCSHSCSYNRERNENLFVLEVIHVHKIGKINGEGVKETPT